MRIGLFFGSFNPVHHGHLMLAQYMASFSGVDEVWFVVSPQNPFKHNAELAPAEQRVEMVRIAVAPTPHLRVSDIELHLPTPSYTVNTLRAFEQRHPEHTFVVIMGGDNVIGLPRWREADEVMKHDILVYPRPGIERAVLPGARITYTEAPMIDISSTQLRQWVAQGKNITHFVPAAVADYITEHNLYK